MYYRRTAFYYLLLSILVSLDSVTPRPLRAQTIETEQTSKGNTFLSQQIPLPQDLQPPSSSPFPAPKIPQLLPPPAELFPPTEQITPLPEQFPNNSPTTIVVERFEVIGSTVFSAEELAQVTAEFTKRPISLAEVFQARSQITDLYIKNGYITSGAYIPPQAIQSGVIKIQVIEGKLEDIEILGTGRLNPSYIRSRLAIATKAPVNRERLLEALRLLQLNPLIENLSAELSAGSRTGTNILQVKINEAKTFHSQITLDNGRSPSVGSFRRQLNISEGNLLGLGDALSLTYSNTDGSNSIDANYTLPVNSRNGTIAFSFSNTSSNVIEEPFNILDIQSNSRAYELTFRQPIVQSPTQEFILGLTGSRRESEASYIPGDRIPFPSVGADEEGRTRLSALRFFQEWTTRNSYQVIAVRSQFNLGIDFLNPTINTSAPDGRFFSWQGQAQWARLLAPDTLLLLRANTQLSSRALLPLEQFGLGGQESVRGYRQDYLLTDNGTLVSAEVLIPILRLPKMNGMLQVIPFIDFGVGWNNSGTDNPTPNTLAAAGIGWQWTQNNLTARLDWGIPLISVDTQPGTWQENGLYFSLRYNPF
ncbi:ShlB/FhaC/HecB family hemolysin secretion/activation protein [Anabaena cylindrica FACHB-243]|uniref:Surface antigen (D15) n=1 Tax=Anabaena cylindrica (strain ATCC 27899 / PCC 7122) TaxID=272123 RepID=K9ZHB2_ANACC|nr:MULTISPECIES: ShlB/FhaC/HecB family hemolysin secretion/activation protein [Anabaena]AFZ58628.1 surface antigen (D15) [Anabaena cylindrica PCC 7122]MBD2419973.1 ShlB/FhaC/HecB family hemolysin secretion/activation protein [Anabaena cylindrica FACHB-243]MBY5282880.1 ShlB/FhaC/HecB family hemolysin secretion/activation protein [Anabaena sp. CCAP 1446/1C]MBY5310410.1 ShlB/FhaC/HecB family hemolysin secretion/activation protein [Anabaena sp. CCAP 1446/1C]MCM2407134.1 ShlB/FhaC/HecB family hemol